MSRSRDSHSASFNVETRARVVHIALAACQDLYERIEELRPALAARRFSLDRGSRYRRAGEQAFWLAYVYVDGRRNVVDTPELRHLSFAENAEHFVRQLHEFQR